MKKSFKKEIKIAGAGIAGLTTSIILSKAGYKVKIFEKNKDVGTRFKNDLQGIMNWGFDIDTLDYIKKIGFGSNFWNKPIKKLDVFTPKTKKNSFKMNSPFVYLVKRGNKKETLDYYLKQTAIDCGVEIEFNSQVNLNEMDVVATGPDFKKINAMAMGINFDSTSTDISSAIFDNEFAYNGYSYFFISQGQGVLATCCFGKYARMNEYFKKAVDFFQKEYNFDIQNSQKFTGVGSFNPKEKNKKYIGEAGGFQDYLRGFGIRYAMITGEIMARSIIENKDFEKLCQEEMGGLLKTSISNRLWFSWLTKPSYHIIAYILKKKNPMKIFTRIYRPNFISNLLYPFAKMVFQRKNK